MKKLGSIEELNTVREALESEKMKDGTRKVIIRVAMSTCSISTGSDKVLNAFIEKMKLQAIDHRIIQTGCMGLCHSEPTVEVTLPVNEPVMFGNVDEAKVDEIITSYIKEGKAVEGTI